MRRCRPILLLLLVSSLSLLLFTGCGRNVELKERLIVQAVGVDYKEEQFQVTLQVFSPEGGGGATGAFDVSKLNNKIYQASGNSILEALRSIEQSTGKQVFFGNNQIIAVGEETAVDHLGASLNFFNGNHETKPKTKVVISKGEAAELVSLQIDQQIVPANALESALRISYESGFAFRSSLMDVMRSINRTSETEGLVYMGSSKGADGKDKPEILGSALIGNGKLVGTFTPMETRGARWVRGHIEATTLVVSAEDGRRYSVTAKSVRHRVRARLEGGTPTFSLEIAVDCAVPETIGGRGTLGEEEMKALTQLVEGEIRQEVNMALTRGLWEGGGDVFQFHQYMEKYEPQFWNEQGQNWEELMQQSQVEVKISVHIKSMGLGAQATG